MQGKRRAFGSFQVVALVNHKTSWRYFFPIYWDSCGQSWLSVLGSRDALAAVPQAASTVLCGYSLVGVSSLCAESSLPPERGCENKQANFWKVPWNCYYSDRWENRVSSNGDLSFDVCFDFLDYQKFFIFFFNEVNGNEKSHLALAEYVDYVFCSQICSAGITQQYKVIFRQRLHFPSDQVHLFG